MVLDADLQTISAVHRIQRASDLYLLRLCAQDLEELDRGARSAHAV